MPRARNIASSKPGSQLQSRNQKTDHNFQQKLEQTKPWETRKRGKQSKITKLIRYQKTHNRSLGQLSNKRGEKKGERKTGIDPYQHQVVFYIRRDPTEIFEGIPRPSSIGLRLGLEERIHLSLDEQGKQIEVSGRGEKARSPFPLYTPLVAMIERWLLLGASRGFVRLQDQSLYTVGSRTDRYRGTDTVRSDESGAVAEFVACFCPLTIFIYRWRGSTNGIDEFGGVEPTSAPPPSTLPRCYTIHFHTYEIVLSSLQSLIWHSSFFIYY